MKITHDGNVRLTRKRAALLEAAKFYVTYLKLDAYIDVEIRICFKHGFTELVSAYAQVQHVEQNLLCIEVDAKIGDDIALHILAHEFVHVKQYVTGRLAEDSDGYQLWLGKHVEDGLSYLGSPWELEAMKKQIIMQYAYVAFRDSKDE